MLCFIVHLIIIITLLLNKLISWHYNAMSTIYDELHFNSNSYDGYDE